MVEIDRVEDALTEAGLSFSNLAESGGGWLLKVLSPGTKVPRIVILFEMDGEFVIVSALQSKVSDEPIENMGAAVLRRLIIVGTEEPAAKLEYYPADRDRNIGSMFAAVAHCDTANFTHKTLSARIEAAARLATKLDSALDELKRK